MEATNRTENLSILGLTKIPERCLARSVVDEILDETYVQQVSVLIDLGVQLMLSL